MVSFHLNYGAVLAEDGIPLHYGDVAAEFACALEHAVLMDRSHEGRLYLEGGDRLALVQRMSTNDVEALKPGEGIPTIFTDPIGRIIDRVMIFHQGDRALMLTEPGRGAAVFNYVRRNIFFKDDVRVTDIAPTTRQFVLIGKMSSEIIAQFTSGSTPSEPFAGFNLNVGDHQVHVGSVKSLVQPGQQWSLIVPQQAAEEVWRHLIDIGSRFGMRPAGSLTYNALRIRAGRPGVGRELNGEYIPLEVGLWDEISFHKGCYTGQEIIARMESRQKLARTIVCLQLDSFVEAPSTLMLDGREVGTLTSSVAAPDGINYGIGVVKVSAAVPGSVLHAQAAAARITRLAGVQPSLNRH